MPDTAEDTVLLRVSILKLINHGRRETGAYRLRQGLAGRLVERLIQSAQHVVKTQLATAAFLHRHCVADFFNRTRQHQVAQ